MNLKKIIGIFLLALCSCFMSCKKDSQNAPSNLTIGTLTATIDGQEFKSTIASALLEEQTSTSNFFTIVAQDGTEIANITFVLSNSATLGEKEYADCEGAPDICLTIMFGEFLSVLTTGPGNSMVEFYALDLQSGGSASGIFSGTLTDSFGNIKELKEGQFNVVIL